MQNSAPLIIFWTLIGSLTILLSFAVFINYILRLYNRKQLDFKRNLDMSKIELEKQKLATMIEMQEETQNKISREIHDNVNQLLTLSKLNLNAITHLLDQSNQETIRI